MMLNASKIFTSNGAYLVANVAIADLLTGLNSSVWGMKRSFLLPRSGQNASFSILWTSIQASFLTIFIMSLERYIAIIYPFKANIFLSKTRTILGCIVAWVLSGVSGICMAYYKEKTQLFIALFFEITILVTCFLYCKIFIKLGERRDCLPLQLSGNQGNSDLKREYQLTTVVAALTVILIVTVLPYMIAGQISISTKDNPHLKLFLHYFFPVELMNFVVNPIVYALRLPKYRLAIFQTLRGCRNDNRN
ncbi:melanocortin receptor 3-like [Dendronephthya gigantea]|uniref:melanocortin receptor 3-like n=1 Tax=Dendronephthya gigantea TaxID=151771 RepID=UPI00106ABCE6|nr:melanocortin receptor 3-like [Dendronephthya gigantea]